MQPCLGGNSARLFTGRSCFKIDFPQLMISQVKSARAILSRSYTRLEKRGFLLRSPDGCWKLTESKQLTDPFCETPCGLLEAYRIWDTYREELKACNLKGPSADCPLFKRVDLSQLPVRCPDLAERSGGHLDA